MGNIRVLPSEIYNKISAGEVVERPSSVVKELFENAVDAGATAVKISITEGGIKNITITDNGKGIDKNSFKTAFLQHATSKIETGDDLFAIKTLGFRGEALASIAAVSRVKLVSRTAETDCAFSMEGEGGDFGDVTECAGNVGTTISVSDLFFNTPARLKFLKKPSGEAQEITNTVLRLILANPDISVKYTNNGEQVFNTQGKGLEDAIFSVYGANVFKTCIKIDALYKNYRIYGYVSSPLFPKSNTTYQTLVINGRYVVNSTVANAVKVAFKPYLMTRQYPLYVLHLTIPVEEIDVNVHPNKLDVRFADSKAIFSAFYAPITHAIKNDDRNILTVTEIPQATREKTENPFDELNNMAVANAGENTSSLPFDTVKNNGNTSFYENSNEISHSDGGFVHSTDKVNPSYTNGEKQSGADFSVSSEEKTRLSDDKSLIRDFSREKIPSYGKMFSPMSTVSECKAVYPTRSDNISNGDMNTDSTVTDINKKQSVSVSFDEVIENSLQEINEAYASAVKSDKKNEMAQESFVNVKLVKKGYMFDTYLILEAIGRDSVYLVDQHAAHERLIYDRLCEEFENGETMVQPMLIPYIFSVNPQEYDVIFENLKLLKSSGFDISPFGGNAFRLDGMPALLENVTPERFVTNLLSGEDSVENYKELTRDILARMACRAAVKAGDLLNDAQIESLIKKLTAHTNLKCPHGRPVVLKITRSEIEKWFKRIV